MATKRGKKAGHRLRGDVASEGLAFGPTFALRDAAKMPKAVSSTPNKEKRALKRAIREARAEIEQLIEQSPGHDGENVLAVQLAILGDKKLIEPALARVADGAPAWAAWNQTVATGERRSPAGGPKGYVGEYAAARDSDTRDLRARVSRILAGEGAEIVPYGAIVIADDIAPSTYLETDWSLSGGIALFGGSPTSHISMLARAQGVPMLVGLDRAETTDGTPALLDAERGELILNASADELRKFKTRSIRASEKTGRDAMYLPGPALTPNGTRIRVGLNMVSSIELDHVDPTHCDGIGLVRTEYLFQRGRGLPNEKTQFAVYEQIVEWAAARPVTFRTLDAGGDKPITGLSPENEANPFLGVRGIRLALRSPTVLRMQFRAILRAAALGPVRIMLPMVSVPEEITAAREILDKARDDLSRRKVRYGEADLGMMVEVPAAAIAIDEFDCDFYSIGTNDLIQYTMAVSRDARSLEALTKPDATPLRRLIEAVIRHGRETGREVSLCGDMGGDPRHIGMLLDMGLTNLSVSPAALARTKATIALHEGGEDQKI
ncbi:MAG: phosphoenolpyruvate--protein phosphotransferase [Rhodospirillales bacterium]|jgi:phosphoenolpyruvate-protein phosphotransferase (PTS system enzyme I)|nr:phosphoenolpyruvate--protein phosphotransferase [Rhodospirillales bacterium]